MSTSTVHSKNNSNIINTITQNKYKAYSRTDNSDMTKISYYELIDQYYNNRTVAVSALTAQTTVCN